MLVVCNVADDQFAFTRIGPQTLFSSTGVLGDHGVGRRQNVLRRTVVLFEEDGPSVRVVAFELFDVADRGSAECVDRLIGVTDDAQFGRGDGMVGLSGSADQFTHKHVLRMVGVLVLVDEHVTEAAAVVLGDLGKRLQKRNGLTDEIVEVECVRSTQPLLVVAVDLGDQSWQFGRILIGCDNRLFRPDEFVLQIGDVSGE